MARWPGVLGGAGVVWSSGSSQVREEGGWESGCHTSHRGRTVKGAVLSGEGGVQGGHYSQGRGQLAEYFTAALAYNQL